MWEVIKGMSLIHPQYEVPSYSNLGFDIAGHVLAQKVAGEKSFISYVKKYITDPLGMKSTSFSASYKNPKQAVGYTSGAPTYNVAPLYSLGWDDRAGGMYSTVEDLSKLASAIQSERVPGTRALPGDVKRTRAFLVP